MPGRLAVGRMTEEQLWRRLRGALALLDPQLVPITQAERRRRYGAYREATDIVRELKMRGHQLSLFDS